MRSLRLLTACALAGLLLAPLARAGELYSYVDGEGVVHFSNAPTDGRYRRLRARASGGGVYRAPSGPPRVRALASNDAGSLERWREHIRAAAEKYKLPEA